MIDKAYQRLSLTIINNIFSYFPVLMSVLVLWQQCSPSTRDSAAGKKSMIYHILKRKNAWAEHYYYYRLEKTYIHSVSFSSWTILKYG